MLSHATLLAVAAFPVTFTVRLLVTGLYLNLSLYARFVTAFMVVPVDWIRKTICKKGSN